MKKISKRDLIFKYKNFKVINVGLIGYGRYGKKYFNGIINDKKFKIIKILRKKNLKSKLFTNNKKFFR